VGGKNKLQRFAENKTFGNLFQLQYHQVVKGFENKGKWGRNFFGNNHELILELGCGKGEYTVGLANEYHDKNYIGVDIKGARLWKGLKEARENNLTNVAFIRTRINLIEYYFGKDEVSEIWITFPDPQPNRIKVKKRLTSPWFLNSYARFLKPDGIIHLKTDNIIFFEYTLDIIKEMGHELLYSTYDVYKTESVDSPLTQIQTYYEKIWLEHGTKIKYLKFRLKNDE
jgi:tRNA (guanine-N7-)-methyltransferase